MFESIATIDNPEFINLLPLDISPHMSKCDIKVFYLGQNRNRVSIDKSAALSIASKLRGAPIVGYFKKEVEDYRDHGHVLKIEEGQIQEEIKTKPYGFVPTDAKVWFQKFHEVDELGREVVREYLMTTGYIWDGQYEEAKVITKSQGRPQSMEFFEDSLVGNWTETNNPKGKYFILYDADIKNLCVLGEDVEPCFEGASLVPTTQFNKVDDKIITLYQAIEKICYTLATEGGNSEMENINLSEDKIVENTTNNSEEIIEDGIAETTEETNEPQEVVEAPVEETPQEVPAEPTSEFVSKEEEEKEEEEEEKKEDKEEEEEKNKYSALLEKYSALEANYNDLESKYNVLLAFKVEKDNEAKEELIKSFSMLKKEDIEDIISKKAKYSLDELESKLSLVYAKNRYSKLEQEAVEQSNLTTYNLSSVQVESPVLPEWAQLVQQNELN